MIFIELLLQQKLSFYQSVHSSYVKFGGLFGARLAIFSPFRQASSFGFLWSCLQHIWSVFLFNFLKWNSSLARFTEYRIYNYLNWFVIWWWTLGSKIKYTHSWLFFWQDHLRWQFLVGFKSGMTTCENTSNTGWVLLMFY